MRITIMQQNPIGNKPHFKGFVTVGDKEYEFGAWPARSGKAGVYTGTLKEKQPRAPEVEAMSYAQSSEQPVDLNDEIPF